MSHHEGSPIVSLHRGLALSLQDSLLSAIQQVLVDAGADNVWIQPDPAGELGVHAALPHPVDELEESSRRG